MTDIATRNVTHDITPDLTHNRSTLHINGLRL